MKSEGFGGFSRIGYRYGSLVTISYLCCRFLKGGWFLGSILLKIFANDCSDGFFVVVGRSSSHCLKDCAIGWVCWLS